MLQRLIQSVLVLAAFVAASAAQAGPVAARLDCRSFGQTATNGGTLNIDWATPMMCWATGSTVSGVAVNGAGWVPDVFFDWDWDDNSLGSVTRGGIPMDLGTSVGLVAAHAFKPTAFTESCNGGTNSLHTVKLTVSSVVNGVRESDTATLNVCVENPRTTWPAPVAFCDDANCADDPGVPAGAVHGGNLPDLATILRYCDTNGSARVVLEGGVTFSTGSARISVGGQSCLIESYGSGKARMHFTSTSSSSPAISADNSRCAGYRLNNLEFAGSGAGPRLIAGSSGTGCFALIDSKVSSRPGEELSSLTTADPSGNGLIREAYYIKFTYDHHVSGLNAIYIWGDYVAFVGGEISQTGEHMIRMPQWTYLVVDAMRFPNQVRSKHILAIRQQCQSTAPPCAAFAHSSQGTVSRSEFLGSADGAAPIQFNGNGGGTDMAVTDDVDVVRNSFAWAAPTAADQFILLDSPTSTSATNRFRFIQNALDMTMMNSSSANRLVQSLARLDDFAFLGNVIYRSGGTQVWTISNTPSTGVYAVKNNVCYENGSGRCDQFPGVAESADNISVAADPFDGAAGEPGTSASFGFDDLRITPSSVLANKGALDSIPRDMLGVARTGAPDVGLFEAATGGTPAPTPPPPTPTPTPTAPAAPVLL